MRGDTVGSDFSLELKTVHVGTAITEVIDLVVIASNFKSLNPIYKKARKLTGIKDFTEFQRKLTYSQKVIRNFVGDYVMKRKNGEIKSQVPEGVDLLSFFLQN